MDKNLRVIALVQGKHIGSIIADDIADGTELSMEITIEDGDQEESTYFVEVFADNVVGEDATSRTNLVATYGPLETSGETNIWSLEELEYDDWDYLYFKLSRGSVDPDDTLAYLAPVWFEPNE